MKLDPYLRSDPTKRAVRQLIDTKFEEAIAAIGFGETVRDRLTCLVCDMLAHDFHNLVEPVPTIAPRTGHIIIGLRISDRFSDAFARATENLRLHFHSSITLH